MSEDKNSIIEHYDASANTSHELYNDQNIFDTSVSYPANYFRLQLLLKSFKSKKIKNVLEIGVGEGTPLSALGNAGMDVWGFDISSEMVKKSKENISKNNMNPEQIFLGDIQDSTTYSEILSDTKFDGLIAMGVMPHVKNDNEVLQNMTSLVKSGGSVFIEFRNQLFSLFTSNRNTLDFILNDLLSETGDEIKSLVQKELETRLRMDMPPIRTELENSKAPGYDAILSKFHNPFEITEQFKKLGFKDIDILWYHFHPAMPYLEKSDPELFRKEAISLERDPTNWRGYFLCSAFVIEAIKK
jgi:2-polyprenyl-3-methyl-5-hydroxy-6-metoxy-1,4-benzoquinol methylase